MKFVAVVRAPERLDEAAAAVSEATGLTLAESRMRISPEPPALVARLQAAEADVLLAALRTAGLAVVSIETEPPGDTERTVARRVAFSADTVAFMPRVGDPMEVAWADVQVILRGLREFRLETDRTEKRKTLSVGMTVVTGGLPATRISTKTVHSSEASFQQVILVYARDGRTAALIEGQLDFSCLGPGLHPSSTANMNELSRRLREQAKRAFYDERLLRLGRRPLPFVTEGETRSATKSLTVTRRHTTAALDVLAEVMREALARGLLR
jgi:hypothetical protein